MPSQTARLHQLSVGSDILATTNTASNMQLIPLSFLPIYLSLDAYNQNCLMPKKSVKYGFINYQVRVIITP